MDRENNTTPDRDQPPEGFSKGVLKVPSFDFSDGKFQRQQQYLHQKGTLRSHATLPLGTIATRISAYKLLNPHERAVMNRLFNSCRIQGVYLSGVYGLQRALKKPGNETRDLLYSMASKGVVLLQETQGKKDLPPLLLICPCTHFSYLAASIDLCGSTQSEGSKALSASLKWMSAFQKTTLTDALVAIENGEHEGRPFPTHRPLRSPRYRLSTSDKTENNPKIIDLMTSISVGECTPPDGVEGEDNWRTSSDCEALANTKAKEGRTKEQSKVYIYTLPYREKCRLGK